MSLIEMQMIEEGQKANHSFNSDIYSQKIINIINSLSIDYYYIHKRKKTFINNYFFVPIILINFNYIFKIFN